MKKSEIWMMFLIPLNFIEDFFIITKFHETLSKNERLNELNFYKQGLKVGLGWCFFQIISLIPNIIGSISGFITLILWIIHWRLVKKAILVLKS